MENKEWFESEEFWKNFGPVMFDGPRWAEAPAVAEAVVSMANVKSGAKILDAGCGPGRISVELALLGMDVTGVDIIQAELDAAKETALDEGVSINFIKQDLRTFNSEKKYDLALNLYTSFGYCDTPEEDFSIVQNIYNSLKDGGKFILECTSRESAILCFTEGEWFERSGLTVLTDFSVVGAWEGLRSKWTIINQQNQRIEHEFVQRLYSGTDYIAIMKKAGFKDAKVYGGYDLRPYDQNATTMVIVATK
ncbi:MAG: class I SAM-dependent methyltransferase [Treponema sp.]|nr:class I SAM-dependent methyltransferase [Treponema sp.]